MTETGYVLALMHPDECIVNRDGYCARHEHEVFDPQKLLSQAREWVRDHPDEAR